MAYPVKNNLLFVDWAISVSSLRCLQELRWCTLGRTACYSIPRSIAPIRNVALKGGAATQ